MRFATIYCCCLMFAVGSLFQLNQIIDLMWWLRK